MTTEQEAAPAALDLSAGFKVPEWAAEPAKAKAVVLEMKDGQCIAAAPVGAKKAFVFGRDGASCDHALVHGSASRQHGAVIHGPGGAVYVVDLKSSHGTRVNGRRAEAGAPVPLADGDTFSFGASSRSYEFRPDGVPDGVKVRGAKRRGSERGGAGRDAKRARGGETVRCSHLLVKHAGSRRPSSWKEKKITRPLEEAREMVAGFRRQILADVEAGKGALTKVFASYAERESHCSSHRRGGDLGSFGRGKMQPPFEKASFALGVGEMSEPVESPSGVHIIYRAA